MLKPFSLNRWQKNWLILLAYAALASVLTQPMLWHLTQGAYGQEGRDVLHYVWQLWWAKHALLALGQLPSAVTVLGWPYGIYHPLLFVTPYIDWLALPVTQISSSSTAYNMLVLSAFTLSGFTAYLLGYNLTRNRWAGFVGGLIFAFTAHRWAHAYTGHLYHITLYWGPLFAWAMGHFMRSPTQKWGLWSGLTAGLVALTHVMHAAYWLLPVGAILLIWGWRTFAPVVPHWWSRVFKGTLWAALPFLLIIGPFYTCFFLTLGQTEGDLEAGGIVGNATDLLAFITPAPANPLWHTLSAAGQILPPVDLDENVAYVGLAALLLAGIGLTGRRKKETAPWLWLAVIAAVLSMGPFLKIGGSPITLAVQDAVSYIPLPYAALANIPPLSWGRTTGRLNQTLMMALSVLSAYGVAWLLARFGSRPLIKTGVSLLATFFIVESMVVTPFTKATPAISPYYLQPQPAQTWTEGVLDLPLRNKLEVNRAMFGQTLLARPMVGGYIHRRFRAVEYGQHFADLLFRPATAVPAFASPTDADRLAALSVMNITTVIVHQDLLDNALDQTQEAFIEHLLGQPTYQDDLIKVYQVPPAPPLQQPLLLARASNWTADGLFPESNSPRHAYVYVPQPAHIGWSITVTPTGEPTVLSIQLNDRPTGHVLITQPRQVDIPTTALEPGIYAINLVNDALCQGQAGCAPLQFDRVELRPSPQPVPPAAIWGQDNLRLLDASIRLSPDAGPPLLVLNWLLQHPLDIEPTIFVHIFDTAGQKIGQIDRRILDGSYPPPVWEPGIQVQDVIPLPLPAAAPFAEYQFRLGLYNSATGERVPITAPQTDDNSLTLPAEISTDSFISQETP
jgi:hypothetical protein